MPNCHYYLYGNRKYTCNNAKARAVQSIMPWWSVQMIPTNRQANIYGWIDMQLTFLLEIMLIELFVVGWCGGVWWKRKDQKIIIIIIKYFELSIFPKTSETEESLHW